MVIFLNVENPVNQINILIFLQPITILFYIGHNEKSSKIHIAFLLANFSYLKGCTVTITIPYYFKVSFIIPSIQIIAIMFTLSSVLI